MKPFRQSKPGQTLDKKIACRTINIYGKLKANKKPSKHHGTDTVNDSSEDITEFQSIDQNKGAFMQ